MIAPRWRGRGRLCVVLPEGSVDAGMGEAKLYNEQKELPGAAPMC